MSNPLNPLDIFVTYTYHFELHAGSSWESLQYLLTHDNNGQTNSKDSYYDKESKSCMLINTRRDAHQTIDNVKFGYIGPSANNNGHYIPDGHMTFTVYEANRIAFITKIWRLMQQYNVSTLTSLSWALKVFIVGRTPDNKVITLPDKSEGLVIPMVFAEMDSTFTAQGGEYHMQFVSISTFGGTGNNRDSLENIISLGHFNTELVHKTTEKNQPDNSASNTDTAKAPAVAENQPIKFNSGSDTTVTDACNRFFIALNDNYQKIYKTILKNDNGAKTIKYTINVDPELNKFKMSLETGTLSQIIFLPAQSITSCIFKILRLSKELNTLVADSYDGISTDDHPSVNFVSVLPRLIYKEDSVEVHYDVALYKGTNSDIYGIKNDLEFDYMFSKPGKNVDVISFDIHMRSALAWFGNSKRGGIAFNTTSENNRDKIITANKPTENNAATDNRPSIKASSGDIAFSNKIVPENRGSVTLPGDAVESQQLMFNSIVEMNAAFLPQFTFTIRGNLDLLRAGVILPTADLSDMRKIPFGVRAPLWVKVNIIDPDGHDFFYKGRYNVISIENHFLNGVFTQVLAVMMMNESGSGKSTLSPSKATTQEDKNKMFGWSTGTKTPTLLNPETKALFSKLEAERNLKPGLLASVYRVESSSGHNKKDSTAGAQGPFQFMSDTAKSLGLKDPYDLTQAATAAANYYSDLLKQTHGDLPMALAAYNWGIGNVLADPSKLSSKGKKQGYVNRPTEAINYQANVMGGMP